MTFIISKKVYYSSVLITCWGIMTATDYSLCQQNKEPLFAVRYVGATDVIMFRGIGYHVIKNAWFPNGKPSDEMDSKFGFGWGW